MIKTVAIYVRVSSKDKGQDTDNQLYQLKEYCTKRAWSIFKVYKDHETGTKGRRGRRDFDLMFKEARGQHRFDAVLFWTLDRFSREGDVQNYNLSSAPG